MKKIVSSKPVTLGLVGLGGHGRTIQRAALEAHDIDVVAVYDPQDMEVWSAARRFDCDTVSSIAEMVRRPDIEAVVLVTPNHHHRSQTESALKAGKHVFVEKPIASTVEDGRSMVQAAEEAGRILMVGHNMRYGRAARKVSRLIRQGAVGSVVSVEFHFSLDSGKRLPANSWRRQPGPNLLLSVVQLGIHAIDLFQYFFGVIEEVCAWSRALLLPDTSQDNVVSIVRADNGILGTLVSNYITQVTFEYRISGTEGSIIGTPHTARYRKNADTDSHGDGTFSLFDYSNNDLESFVFEIEAFGTAIRTGTSPETDGNTGLQALAVVEAMGRSARSGVPEKVGCSI